MPSQIFFDAWLGGDIIDACAAPGNKTSHVAALVQGCDRPEKERVNIYACEKSETRCELLRNRMKLAGANNVIPLNVDFLSLQSNDPKFSKVASILVDPSCSGSGVVRAIDRVYERVKIASVDQPAISTDRLKQLQAFQIRAVLHAMSFPSVQLVVYSTCSVDLVNEPDLSPPLA